ncbi:MAG: VapC toxin family PIN domain ribonuclease [Methylocystaceae bacterium]|nr:MAG: VapC toxin family PIN domain ribonuclease [Methylocystaceae bacterium]
MTRTDVFFDTNILVYLLSGDIEKARRSESLLARGGMASVQVLNEYVSVCRRKHRAPWEAVLETIAAFKSTLTILPISLETHERGLALAQRHNFAIYDAMIVAAAQLSGCSTLYTEDMHNGLALGGLRIVDPYA